ncbi:short-chain dehydrogenase [Chromatiales bacterium (ex Bugula neritina AB1)]|nr:short-chain dehydrogenase [Chromatiales bacterium (ex Bugula neritina AB1)]
MKVLVVFGATSAIAQAYLNRVAARYDRLILVARNAQAVEEIAAHLSVLAKADVEVVTADLADIAGQPALLDRVFASPVECALIAYGELTDQQRCIEDHEYAMRQMQLNGTSTISLASGVAQKMVKQKSGTLAVISSVAGDRGRRSNYFYGTAKGAVSTFLSGLRSDMVSQGVTVITVKPGFVDTPMTKEFKKGLLWASADTVAANIDAAIAAKKPVLYTPWFWRYIMLIIKLIPEFIFKRLPL